MTSLRILITCIHYPVASGRYMARAFRRLGHDVQTAGHSTGTKIWGMEVDERYVWKPDWEDGFAPGTRRTFHPDLVIHAESAYAGHRINGVPLILWGMDNHVRDYASADYDAMFFAHSWGARSSEPNAYWLPPGYDPEMHTDLGRERDIDVLIIGYPYSERVEILAAMDASGLKNTVGMLGPLFDEYNALYNRAKIALVRSSYGDLTTRFFENMAQGCCVLADTAPDIDRLGFIAGTDFWPYASAPEAVEAAHALLVNDRWRSLAAAGKEKVKSYTWDARALELLRRVRELKIA